MSAEAIGASITGLPQTAAGVADAKLADNFDTFLTLLTTQLQHQDPLEPMDANQFTEQLVQFSQVEQSITSNKHLEQLLSMVSTNSTADAVSYLGKTIEAQGRTAMLSGGKATWRYLLPEVSENTTITVTNDAGKLVYATTGNLEAGSHEFTWDGKDTKGETQPDGAYTIAVSASNALDEGLAVETFVSGTVDGVQNNGDGVVLMLQDVGIPATSVRTVGEPSDSLTVPDA
ncbi:MAG: flagellar hook capping FlgD N-terminal domain-containing protein [Alphaproteobacteria bacterium]|jgi:flagellar basal-body rod modification protein FlgD|nr:flagellar hook capping FlgD N-terminal domain-containing protein [Alphaproteobacteria bacterium]